MVSVGLCFAPSTRVQTSCTTKESETVPPVPKPSCASTKETQASSAAPCACTAVAKGPMALLKRVSI